jgi:MFS family permease
VPYYKVISNWFDKRRGLALGLTMAGAGLGFFVMPALSYALISNLGWRMAYVVIGISVVVVTIPVVALFLRETPQSMGLMPDGEQVSEEIKTTVRERSGLTGKEAMHSATFWVMCASLFLVSLALNGCLIHLVPLLTDRGVSPQTAALSASVLGGATLLGRLGTGYLLDKFFAATVAMFFFSLGALGVLMLWTGVGGWLSFLVAILLGLGIGAEGDIMPYLVGRYFGLKSFGEIYAYVLAIYTLGAVVGPIVMGVGFDSTGSYDIVLIPFLMLTLVGALLLTRLGPYVSWKPIGETVIS